MKKSSHWDAMYKRPAQSIPWEINDPPADLTEYLEAHGGVRGVALDIGCGTGNYSIYLANEGFQEVFGIDFSEQAIAIASERAAGAGLTVTFTQGDVLALDQALSGKRFDFILDYSILHHVSDKDVPAYVAQCRKALNNGGKLLLVCYTEHNEFATGTNGTGKYGNEIFFRTADEVRQLYAGFTEVSYKKSVLGKRGQHEAHSFIVTK